MKPGASDIIMNLAAELSLGRRPQKPRFGIMGKIVRNLGLFDDVDDISNQNAHPQISQNYNAPVQIFNGPVIFGNSSDSFQNFMNKRSREVESGNTIIKRRHIESKEETFIT